MTYSPIDPLTRTRFVAAFDDCWFCGRHTHVGRLIAGYDDWDEQRLACDDCDRTLKAMAARGYYFQKLRPDPDPLTVEPLPETGYYDEPPRRVSLAIYVLGALFLVTAVVVLWAVKR